MKNILLLSDTHSHIDTFVIDHILQCDEVWHAGDIGSTSVIDTIQSLKPLRAVFGNIDSWEIRAEFSEELIFHLEGFKIMMTHIGGSPKRYPSHIKERILQEKPQIFICGHSHILKVIYDKELQTLHLNPGAVGLYGSHTVRTMLSFSLDKRQIKDMKIIETPRNT